jgi:hypothetical protein
MPRILFPFLGRCTILAVVWFGPWQVDILAIQVIENTEIYNTRQSVGCIVRKLRDFFRKDWVYTIAVVQANENSDNVKLCDRFKHVLSPKPVSKTKNSLGKTPAVWRALLHGKIFSIELNFFPGS